MIILRYTLAIIHSMIAITVSLLVRVFSHKLSLRMASFYWSKIILKILRIKLDITNATYLHQNPNAVYIANHQSIFDIPILFKIIPNPIIFVLKQELKRIPFLGLYCLINNMVFVDRKSRRSRAKSIVLSILKMRKQLSILIFPEGTRNTRKTGVSKLNKGAFVIAYKTQSPIVPIVIKYKTQHTVTIQVLKPIQPTQRQDIAQLIQHTQQTMQQSWNAL